MKDVSGNSVTFFGDQMVSYLEDELDRVTREDTFKIAALIAECDEREHQVESQLEEARQRNDQGQRDNWYQGQGPDPRG